METLRHGNIELQRNELHNFFISRHTKMRVSAFYEFQSERSEITTTKIFKVQIPIYFRKRFEISFLRNIRDGSQRPILPKEKRIQNILIYYSKENVRKRRKVRISVHLLSSPPPFLVSKGAEREKRTRFSFIPPHPAVNAFYGSLSCVTISEAQMGGKNRHRISPFVSICGFLFPIFCSIL